MKAVDHYNSASKLLIRGMVEYEQNHDDSAINFFVAAISASRELLDHTWRRKCDKALKSKPPKGP